MTNTRQVAIFWLREDCRKVYRIQIEITGISRRICLYMRMMILIRIITTISTTTSRSRLKGRMHSGESRIRGDRVLQTTSAPTSTTQWEKTIIVVCNLWLCIKIRNRIDRINNRCKLLFWVKKAKVRRVFIRTGAKTSPPEAAHTKKWDSISSKWDRLILSIIRVEENFRRIEENRGQYRRGMRDTQVVMGHQVETRGSLIG